MAQRDKGASAFRQTIRDHLDEACELLPLTQREICARMGWREQSLSNWLSKTGKTQIPLYELSRFCREFGFTTDFLVLGDVSGLSVKLAGDLAKARQEKTEA